MQLLLCAAAEFEIKPAIDFIRSENIKKVNVLITGIGLTAATYSLTKAIFTNKPGFIIQAGIGGCLHQSLSLGKVAIVENEMIGDLGVEQNEKFNSLFDLGFLNAEEFPWKNRRLSNNIETLKKIGLPVIDGVTVNEITTDKKRIIFYKTELKATVESMEGAALHYVALMENISFVQVRSLSNFAGERDKSKWMMDMAITNLNHELIKIITNFNP